ncbi:MAG: polysaccharide deacetylase family protein [Sedimentibacter sp.]
MHGYRLTSRGKFALTFLIMLVCLAVSINLMDIAKASDKSEYIKQVDTIYLDKAISAVYELDIRKTAMVYNERLKLDDEALKEDKEFLSINVEDIKSYDKSKIAFLTFDDGPSKSVTPEILDVLDNYGIKATFFVLGNMCEKNGIVLKALIEKGHSIGIHSYSHRLQEMLISKESFLNEIVMTEKALKEHLGEDFKTRLFRFPGGSFEDYKMQYMDVLNEHGYISIDWNALTGDTEYLNPTPDILLNRLKETTINKDKIIVLMHDSDTRHVTAEVLPDVIEYLISEGYEFAILK